MFTIYAGMRTSARLVLVHVLQVYAVTVYVEGEKAARELGVRERGGFFDDNRCVGLLPITPVSHARISACSACLDQVAQCLAIPWRCGTLPE